METQQERAEGGGGQIRLICSCRRPPKTPSLQVSFGFAGLPFVRQVVDDCFPFRSSLAINGHG